MAQPARSSRTDAIMALTGAKWKHLALTGAKWKHLSINQHTLRAEDGELLARIELLSDDLWCAVYYGRGYTHVNQRTGTEDELAMLKQWVEERWAKDVLNDSH